MNVRVTDDGVWLMTLPLARFAQLANLHRDAVRRIEAEHAEGYTETVLCFNGRGPFFLPNHVSVAIVEGEL